MSIIYCVSNLACPLHVDSCFCAYLSICNIHLNLVNRLIWHFIYALMIFRLGRHHLFLSVFGIDCVQSANFHTHRFASITVGLHQKNNVPAFPLQMNITFYLQIDNKKQMSVKILFIKTIFYRQLLYNPIDISL